MRSSPRPLHATSTALLLWALAPATLAAGAQFGAVEPSEPARRMADWVVASRDNATLPFVVLDKRDARLYVFEAGGRLQGASPVLLGLARGDHSVDGIGTRKMSEIRPHERTTPAGRFVAERGVNVQQEDIVWVDYDAAVSMHRVRANNPVERRLERLASATPDDNRISYGCINVPARFYDGVVAPAFAASRGIVYVLPEMASSSLLVAAPSDTQHGSPVPTPAEAR